MKLALTAAFAATVIGANWAVGRYGVVPLGFGLAAPAGVYFAGLAFGLRDALHEAADRYWVIGAIALGAVISFVIEDAARVPGGLVPLALASAVAFALSELADLKVYEPLRAKSWPGAVALSNLVAAVVDSTLFLWLAFGGLGHLDGQVAGKLVMIAVAIPIVWLVRRQRRLAVA